MRPRRIAAIWSGTAFMKSVTATIGPRGEELGARRGTRGWIGCSRFQRSVVSACSRSFLYDVADQRSAATS